MSQTVLAIDDSPDIHRLLDVRLKPEGLVVHHALDAADGMAQAIRNTPDLILLDLNLPKKDGREVLEEIKESTTLKSIPVVILTTSASEADILKSYRLHANCYITKPVGLGGFLEVIKSIDSFWLSVVKLPREDRL